MQGAYYVYILASKKNGTLYVGVTNNLGRRLAEHTFPASHASMPWTNLSILKPMVQSWKLAHESIP